MPGLDRLVSNLEEQRATSFYIPGSPKQFMEEGGLVDYIQAMSMNPSIEAGDVLVRGADDQRSFKRSQFRSHNRLGGHKSKVENGKRIYVPSLKKHDYTFDQNEARSHRHF